MDETEVMRCRAALDRFATAFRELLSTARATPAPGTGRTRLGPKPGGATEFAAARREVDQAAGAAAQALDATGRCLECRPAGSHRPTRVNPVAEWSTVIEEFPAFVADDLLACCDLAIGELDARLALASTRPGRRHAWSPWRVLSWLVVAIVVPVVAGVCIAAVSALLGY